MHPCHSVNYGFRLGTLYAWHAGAEHRHWISHLPAPQKPPTPCQEQDQFLCLVSSIPYFIRLHGRWWKPLRALPGWPVTAQEPGCLRICPFYHAQHRHVKSLRGGMCHLLRCYRAALGGYQTQEHEQIEC